MAQSVAQWKDSVDSLKRFRQRNGHCRVPYAYRDSITGYPLGMWVSTQRKEQDTLPPERWQQLDALGFVWNLALVEAESFRLARKEAFKPWGPAQQEMFWEGNFHALELFIQREGHCRVPDKHRVGVHYLGRWVVRQRKIKDTLSPEKRARLDKLGFLWNPVVKKRRIKKLQTDQKQKRQTNLARKQHANKNTNKFQALRMMLSGQEMTFEGLAKTLNLQSTEFLKRGKVYFRRMQQLGARFRVRREGRKIVGFKLSNLAEMQSFLAR